MSWTTVPVDAPLAWAPDGTWIASAQSLGFDVTITRVQRIGDEPATRQVAILTYRDPVASLSVSRDGLWLAAGHTGGLVTIRAVNLQQPSFWPEVTSGTVPWDHEENPQALTLVEFSPTEDTLAAACGTSVNWLRMDGTTLAEIRRWVESTQDNQDETSIAIRFDRSSLSFTATGGPERFTVQRQVNEELVQTLVRSLTEDRGGAADRPSRAVDRRGGAEIRALQELVAKPLMDHVDRFDRGTGPVVLRVEGGDNIPWELLLQPEGKRPWAVERGVLRGVDAPARPFPPAADGLAFLVRVGDANSRSTDLMVKILGDLLARVYDRVEQLGPRELPEKMEDLQPRFVGIVGSAHATEDEGGVILMAGPDGLALTPGLFAIATPPEVVFIACPHTSEWHELLRAGVRALITLDWPVYEDTATIFARELMTGLVNGATLSGSIRSARSVVYSRFPESSAWASFRCHGDPGYRMIRPESAEQGVDLRSLAAAVPGNAPQTPLVAIPGRDVVVVDIEGGPQLALHPQTARDLVNATAPGPQDDRPAPGSATGSFKNILLKAFSVLTKTSEDQDPEQLRRAIAKVDRRDVPSLQPFSLRSGPPAPELANQSGLRLVVIPGLMSTGNETFSPLWQGATSDTFALNQRFSDRVFSYDYPTLSMNPIEAALILASSCPSHTRMHLLTHSTGGLVAEALVRAAEPSAHMERSIRSEDPKPQKLIDDLVDVVSERDISIERVVRVACPARGMLFASGRLDAFLSVFNWAEQSVGVNISPAQADLLQTVALLRTKPADIPGLAALAPDSPFIQWLNDETVAPSQSDLRIVAGDLASDSVSGWIKQLLSDAYYWTDNDLVVQTRSMFGGIPRAPGCASFYLASNSKSSHFNYFREPATLRAILDALLRDQPTQFKPVGPLSWAGESPSGDR